MSHNKTILITGSSAGIGKATVEYFIKKRWNVAATMRDPSKFNVKTGDNLKTYKMDVNSSKSIKVAVSKVLKDFGSIDVLVNNAGFASRGPLELSTKKSIKDQFDTNLFGVIDTIKEILPIMRQNKEGIIINVSSAQVLFPGPYNILYSTSKWALEGLSEALSVELYPFGIRTKIIVPGAINTNFRENSVIADVIGSPYEDGMESFWKMIKNLVSAGSSASSVAEAIYKAATDKSDRLRYQVGKDSIKSYKRRSKLGDEEIVSSYRKQLFS